MIQLRDYQEECIEAILKARDTGITKQAVSLPTGCHAAGTKILMYDGSLKNVEDIQVNDLLMGIDSKARRVLKLHKGTDEMYRITPVKGEPFVVNKDHILSLKKTCEGHDYPCEQQKINNISVGEYLNKSSNFKHLNKLYRTGVEFGNKYKLPIDPYFLGILLGDGCLCNGSISISTPDEEIVNECYAQAKRYGLDIRINNNPNSKANEYYFIHNKGKKYKHYCNPIREKLRELQLLNMKSGEKFIPDIYKTSPREQRLQILAGLLDTDGYMYNNSFEYCTKSPSLCEGVLFMVRSLGLAAYANPKVINGETYYRIHISGDCSVIPTKIPRKQAQQRKQKKDVLVTGFTVESIGVSDYYGFTIDADNLYLMSDFTVTHNCGKTITFAQLAKQLNVRTLILAHRDELINQSIDKVSLVWPDVSIGKVKAETNEYTAQVVVASVQSAYSVKRIEELKKQDFQLMIIDECHHSTSESYRKIIDELQCPLLVGFTATMDRSDGVGLSNIFEKITFERSLPTMINCGYLCDIKGQKIVTNVNLDAVKTVAGDFAVGQLSSAVNTPKRNRIVVDGYMKYAEGKKGIAFCADVQHSKDLAALFNESGIPATAVYGNMPAEERQQALRDFKDGKIKILTNCNVLTEGFDEPGIEVVLMARPTKSRSMYIQMVGRGTRLFPNKQHCLVIDFFDSRQDICRLGTLAGKEVRDGQTLREAIREHEETQRKAQETAAALHTQEQEFDIMDRSKFKWFTMGTDFRLTLDKKLYIYLRKFDNERYVAQLYDDCTLVEELCSPLDLGYAMGIAEDYCRKQVVTTNLSDKTAPWRKKKATQSQKKMMNKHNIPFNSKTTAGEASDLIGAVLSAKQAWKLKPATQSQIQEIRKAGRKVPKNLTKGEAYKILQSIKGA